MSLDVIEESERYAHEAVICYLECAAWTSEPDEADLNWDDAEWSDDAVTKAKEAVTTFMVTARDLLAECPESMDAEQVGHDLWLTRNGHGCGFWDRGLGDLGDRLSEIASAMGEQWACLGDDGQLYL